MRYTKASEVKRIVAENKFIVVTDCKTKQQTLMYNVSSHWVVNELKYILKGRAVRKNKVLNNGYRILKECLVSDTNVRSASDIECNHYRNVMQARKILKARQYKD